MTAVDTKSPLSAGSDSLEPHRWKEPTMTDPTQLDADVKRYLELDALKADIQIEQDAIKERLRASGTQDAPCGVRVTVTPNRRFNATRAEEVLPPELLALCRVEVIDAKKAKEVLPPAVYEQTVVEVGQPRVTLR